MIVLAFCVFDMYNSYAYNMVIVELYNCIWNRLLLYLKRFWELKINLIYRT